MYISSKIITSILSVIAIIVIAIVIAKCENKKNEKKNQELEKQSIRRDALQEKNQEIALLEKKHTIREIALIFNCHEDLAQNKYEILCRVNSLFDFQLAHNSFEKKEILDHAEHYYYYVTNTLMPLCVENSIPLNEETLFSFQHDFEKKDDISPIEKLKQIYFYENNDSNHRISINEDKLLRLIQSSFHEDTFSSFFATPELKWELNDVQKTIDLLTDFFNTESVTLLPEDFHSIFFDEMEKSLFNLQKIFSYILYRTSGLYRLFIAKNNNSDYDFFHQFMAWNRFIEYLFFSAISYDIVDYEKNIALHIDSIDPQ